MVKYACKFHELHQIIGVVDIGLCQHQINAVDQWSKIFNHTFGENVLNDFMTPVSLSFDHWWAHKWFGEALSAGQWNLENPLRTSSSIHSLFSTCPIARTHIGERGFLRIRSSRNEKTGAQCDSHSFQRREKNHDVTKNMTFIIIRTHIYNLPYFLFKNWHFDFLMRVNVLRNKRCDASYGSKSQIKFRIEYGWRLIKIQVSFWSFHVNTVYRM